MQKQKMQLQRIVINAFIILMVAECLFAFTEDDFRPVKPEKPIQPFTIFTPIPEINKQPQKGAVIKESVKNREPVKSEKVENSTERKELQEKENPPCTSMHVEELKKLADTRWFKVKTNGEMIIISGMTQKNSLREEIEKYCNLNKLKCKIELVEIK